MRRCSFVVFDNAGVARGVEGCAAHTNRCTHEVPLSNEETWRSDVTNKMAFTGPPARDQVENAGMLLLGKIDWLPRSAALSGLTLRTSWTSKKEKQRRTKTEGKREGDHSQSERDREGGGSDWENRQREREKQRDIEPKGRDARYGRGWGMVTSERGETSHYFPLSSDDFDYLRLHSTISRAVSHYV